MIEIQLQTPIKTNWKSLTLFYIRFDKKKLPNDLRIV